MKDSVVFDEMLGALSDAISVAEDALKEADTAKSAKVEKVRLVKVASATASDAARKLIATGAFPGHTAASLSKTFEQAGPTQLLEHMVKLASTAVFPLDSDLLERDGDLVEKAASNNNTHVKTDAEHSSKRSARVALYDKCLREAGIS